MSASDSAIDWCSQSEASRRLSDAGDAITQQQLSRYLDRYPEIPRKDQGNGRAMLVDFDALKRHREQNIRVQEAKPTPSGADDDESAELRLRERRAAAELRELELARAKEEVIPRAAVVRAVQAAAVTLEQAFARSRFERAEALEAAGDTRSKAAVLEQQDFAVRDAFAQALNALASSDEGAETEDQANEETESAADPSQSAHAAPN